MLAPPAVIHPSATQNLPAQQHSPPITLPESACRPASQKAAFSLIEVLVVVAIVVLLASLAVPAVSSMGQSRGVNEAAYQIAAAVEQARAEAISRNTYVWLAIEQTNASGNQDITLGLVASKNGNFSNTSPTNLQPLARPATIQGVLVAAPQSSLSNLEDISNHSGGITFSIGSTNFSQGRTLLFSPSGEVAKASPPANNPFAFDRLVGIGLQPSRASDEAKQLNQVDVLIDGSVGIPKVKRPSGP